MSQRTLKATLASLFCAVLLYSCASTDPFTGVWKLDLEKSKLPAPLPQSQTVHIQVVGMSIHVQEEIVNDKGERITITGDARFDGKDYSIKGSDFADSVAYERLDRNTIKGAGKKAGKVVVNETAVLSKDAKTLTTTYTGTDASGRQGTYVAVFHKQ
jgi:hypothetical protein